MRQATLFARFDGKGLGIIGLGSLDECAPVLGRAACSLSQAREQKSPESRRKVLLSKLTGHNAISHIFQYVSMLLMHVPISFPSFFV